MYYRLLYFLGINKSHADTTPINEHLGSTSLMVSESGTKTGEMWYKAWGETCYSSGSTPTIYRYTGQRAADEVGLMFYGARWYDSSLGRFTSPDTVVPLTSQGTQAWDRYAYANNSPIRYNDPTGHDVGCSGRDASDCASKTAIMIACGVKDGPCGPNTETMNPAYEYAVDNNYQVYFYDPDNSGYNSKHAKYDVAQDMSGKIKNNPSNDFYLVGYSAGSDATILATEMTEYSSNIKGVGVIDPYLNYTDPNGKVFGLQSQAEKIAANIPLAVADSPKDNTPVLIPGAILPDKNTQALINTYEHYDMGINQNVFDFIFSEIMR